MIAVLDFSGKQIQADLSQALDISIPLKEGKENPNCYWAEDVKFETIVADGFIGSVARGGSVNYQKITMTPHGNGTHTECYGHISASNEATLDRCLKRFHFFAEVISVVPAKKDNGDFVITKELLAAQLNFDTVEALVIRTLPNDEGKKNRAYSGSNPPYLEAPAVALLVERGIQHLLVDLPSIDKENDEGQLLAHKTFWRMPQAIRKQCTITELIYVPAQIEDGLYLLNLQITSLQIDASPSKPILYKTLHL